MSFPETNCHLALLCPDLSPAAAIPSGHYGTILEIISKFISELGCFRVSFLFLFSSCVLCSLYCRQLFLFINSVRCNGKNTCINCSGTVLTPCSVAYKIGLHLYVLSKSTDVSTQPYILTSKHVFREPAHISKSLCPTSQCHSYNLDIPVLRALSLLRIVNIKSEILCKQYNFP